MLFQPNYITPIKLETFDYENTNSHQISETPLSFIIKNRTLTGNGQTWNGGKRLKRKRARLARTHVVKHQKRGLYKLKRKGHELKTQKKR